MQNGISEYPKNKVLFISGVSETYDTIIGDDGTTWDIYDVEGVTGKVLTGSECIIKFDKPVSGKRNKCYVLFEW